ncbi:MAG: cell division protein FtsQ/DivIB [Solirubrobacteraceae bacterium]
MHSGLGVLRPLTGAARLVRAGLAFVLRRRRLRFALLAVVIAMPLLGGGWLWLRKSSFVSVQQVQITGVHGPEAQAVQAALEQAAHGMSTLAVSDAALRAAVAPLRVVRSVRAIPHFPHGLRIEVSEQLPVAALTVAGVRTAVAADGVVLGPSLLSGSLPSVGGYAVPAPGERVHGASLLAALTVLGAAPAPLARHAERVFTGAEGLTVAMRNGLLVYFGDAGRPHAKWLSLARVLADSSSAGASYIDVRLPSHPAAGFPAGVTPPDASATTSTAPGEALGSSESAIESLAAGLLSGSVTTSATGAEPSAASASGASATSPEGSEASTGEGGAGGQAGGSQTSAEPGG